MLCPPSPLKSNLPPAIMSYNVIYSSQQVANSRQTPQMGRGLVSPLMTPNTMRLFAFGEQVNGATISAQPQTCDLDKIGDVFSKVRQYNQNAAKTGAGAAQTLKNQLIK